MSSRQAVLGLAIALTFLPSTGQAADEETWWSLRQPTRPKVPEGRAGQGVWCRTPVDRFILAKLREKGLSPSPEADKRTLLRRVTFDLTGLPPTPEEIDAFLQDSSPNAYEKVVDRLLSSPHYGERWARHWMDIAHYAETHGHDQDRPRPNAWPYRDYLIRSFNFDKPYARFVREQIAGDVLWPDDADAIYAMGFLATGPWDESSLRDIRDDTIDRQIARYIDRDDMVTTAMSTFISSTVHCARCHDHKFDPISQQDYYALQAVFAGVDKADHEFETDAAVAQQRKQVTEAKARIAPIRNAAWMNPAAESLLLAAESAVQRRSDTLPPIKVVYAATSDFKPDGSFRPSGKPREVRMLKRGDINKPGPEARPGALACVPGLAARFRLADAGNEGSRRVALADWITNPKNPLTWRSIVNRVWHYHFGKGIVDTANDFGRMGAKPTHPELLDWLAVSFQEHGGSLKWLHRLIVTSAVFRQSSHHDSHFGEMDGENRYLWRMNRTRLDAEEVRDAVLLAAGRLDRTMGGPSVKQFNMSPGIHVTPVVDYAGFDVDRPENYRRSVYRFVFRTLPDPLMEALDCPDSSQLTPARTDSVTPLQALAMLNNKFMVRMSEHLAERATKTGPDIVGQIAAVYRFALGREPTAESTSLVEYARRHGLANACRVVLNSNEFIFLN
jgi:hypothetical protein